MTYSGATVKRERIGGGMYNILSASGEVLRGPAEIIDADKEQYGDDAIGKKVQLMGCIRWRTARAARGALAEMARLETVKTLENGGRCG